MSRRRPPMPKKKGARRIASYRVEHTVIVRQRPLEQHAERITAAKRAYWQQKRGVA